MLRASGVPYAIVRAPAKVSLCSSFVIQKSVRLKYEPASESLHICVK